MLLLRDDARFQTTTVGASPEPTYRIGTKESGMSTSIGGRKCGVEVIAFVDDLGRDVFEVNLTGGTERELLSIGLLSLHGKPDGSVDVVLVSEKLGAAPGAFPVTIRDHK